MKTNQETSCVFILLAFMSFLTACGASPAVNNAAVIRAASNDASSSKSTVATNAANKTNSNVAAPSKPFSQTLELYGIEFLVESPNSATGNTVKVTPSGLAVSNDVQTMSVNGEVYSADVGDLNVDQSPEVYIFTRETVGNNKAGLIAYSANNKKSLSGINLPADDPNSKDLEGYNGGDEFFVVENRLVRRFPIYDGASPNANKTGKTRQFQYKLKSGEASWQLFKYKVLEF